MIENALFLGKWLLLAYLFEAMMIHYVPAEMVASVLGGDVIRYCRWCQLHPRCHRGLGPSQTKGVRGLYRHCHDWYHHYRNAVGHCRLERIESIKNRAILIAPSLDLDYLYGKYGRVQAGHDRGLDRREGAGNCAAL